MESCLQDDNDTTEDCITQKDITEAMRRLTSANIDLEIMIDDSAATTASHLGGVLLKRKTIQSKRSFPSFAKKKLRFADSLNPPEPIQQRISIRHLLENNSSDVFLQRNRLTPMRNIRPSKRPAVVLNREQPYNLTGKVNYKMLFDSQREQNEKRLESESVYSQLMNRFDIYQERLLRTLDEDFGYPTRSH